MRRLGISVALAIVAAVTVGCADTALSPAAPASVTSLVAGAGGGEAESGAAGNGPASPPFNLQAVLRAPDGADGFGLVEFRQPNDGLIRVNLDVWVRALAPDTEYALQRAVDGTLDGDCPSEAWLTLGAGLAPLTLWTDAGGTGRQSFYRDLPPALVGLGSDIHFRIVTTTSPPVEVLRSGCYRYIVQGD